MLAGWGETHNGGAKLTFWLPDATDLDVFRGLTVRKGNTAGQRFMAVLVEVGEDELPAPATDTKIFETAKEAVKGGQLSRVAAMLCQDPEFQDWIFDRKGLTMLSPTVDRQESAAALIRMVCGVESRAELDHNPAAAKIFHDEIRKPWVSSGVTR